MLSESTVWTAADLSNLISAKAEESSMLEFKRSDALNLDSEKHKSEISKDIASFANSAGGVIIYGIVESEHCASSLDNGVDPKIISKERLEQILISKIKPRILGLDINPVKLDHSPGNIVYVITIPQSSTAHQSDDKRYYRRFNFLATAMEDHEIRDVMNRNRFPIIDPIFSFEQTKNNAGKEHEYCLWVTLKNLSSLRAHQIRLELCFPDALYVEGSHIFTGSRNQMVPDKKYKVIKLKFFKSDQPIFPDDELKINIFNYKINENLFGLDKLSPTLEWKLYADDAPCIIGKLPVEQLHNF